MRFRTAAVLCMAAGLAAPVQAKDRAEDLRGKWQYRVAEVRVSDAPERREDGRKPHQDDGMWWIPVWPPVKPGPPGERRQGFEARGEGVIRDGVLVGFVEFGDGTIATRVGTEAAETLTYKVMKSDQSIVWLEVTSRDKPGAPAVTMIAAFKDADTVQFWPEANPEASLVLKRVKAAAK